MKTEKMNYFDDIKKTNTPAFGIDLGTTNSACGILKTGVVPEIIKLNRNAATLPSCVAWMGEDKFVVGKEAYNKRHLPNVQYSIKRLMGSDKPVEFEYEGKKKYMLPEEVSAEILKQLCIEAGKDYGKIEDVVITVPAYFDNKQLEATRKAGELAGLNVLSTLREPTSASLLYNVLDKDNKSNEENVLVYDLGGGTFDISLVKITKKVESKELDEFYGFETEKVSSGEEASDRILTVVKNEGDTKLGGDDVDIEMYKVLERKISNEGIDVTKIPEQEKERLIAELESIKKKGFKDRNVSVFGIKLNCILEDENKTKVYKEIKFMEQDLREATAVIYKKTKTLVDRVLYGVDVKKIKSLVLVGGSTKSELIREFLRRDFSHMKLNCALNPDESVALGASIQAKRLKYGLSNLQIFDILPLSIGILADNLVSKVIHKNQVVPYSATKLFATKFDDQESIAIDVYQGNSSLPEECINLGQLYIDNIPKGKAGTVGIYVTLRVNAEGILNCKARVGEQSKELVLTNLFTGDLETKKRTEDRRVLRWRRFAKTQTDPTTLNKLIDEFELGKDVENLIIDYIRKHKVKTEFKKEKRNLGNLEVR